MKRISFIGLKHESLRASFYHIDTGRIDDTEGCQSCAMAPMQTTYGGSKHPDT